MPKYRVKIYVTCYEYEVEAKDENEAELKAIHIAGYGSDSSEIASIKVEPIEIEQNIESIYKIYDNGGKTADRYTVLTEPFHFGKSCESLGLSDDCDSPDGFSQWGEAFDGDHLGKEISFDDLPPNVKNHLFARIKDE